MEINRTQRTTAFQRLAQGRACRRVNVRNRFQLGGQGNRSGSNFGRFIIFRHNHNLGICAVAVVAFGQQFQAGTLARGRDIAADDVFFSDLGRIGVGVADFRCSRFGGKRNFTAHHIDGVVFALD